MTFRWSSGSARDRALGEGGAAPVIVVTSACGGCGVTTIALHLARCYRGCFVESARDAGAAERLGLDRAALRTWAPGSDDPTAALRLAALPMPGGFRALFAPGAGWGTFGVAGAADLGRTLVVDVPAGAPVPEVCASIGVVMPPTSPGAARTRALLERIPPRPHAVVVNRQGPGGEATRARLQVALGSTIALELPCCPALRDAEDDGALLARHARWARRVERLAVGLAGAAHASPERAG